MTEHASAAPVHTTTVAAADSLRAVATIAVVVYHSWLITGAARLDGGVARAVIGSGWIGVDVFFVLSGFVHFLPVVKRGTLGSWRSYAWRRVARVVPAYYACLVVVLILVKHIDVPGLLVHMAFLHVPFYGLSPRTGLNADQPLWTLSIEAAFYVALVFAARPFLKRPVHWVIGALVVAAAWKLAAPNDFHRGVQFPGFVAHFALGMAAAVVFVRGRWSVRWTVPLLAASTVAFLVAGALLVDTDAAHHFNRNLALAVPLTGIVLASAFMRWPVVGPLRFISTISYGTYLFHILVIGRLLRWVAPDGSGTAFAKMVALTLPISLLIGWLSYVLIESPARNWARRLAA